MKKVSRMVAMSLAMVGLSASLWIAWAEDKSEQAQREKTFMRAKLIHTQKALEGLLTEDFDTIIQHSQKMSLLTRALSWQTLETTEYTQRSTAFRRSVDTLTQAAKKKNLDRASLAYLEMTIQCFQCHQYVRKKRHTRLRHPKMLDSIDHIRLAQMWKLGDTQ